MKVTQGSDPLVAVLSTSALLLETKSADSTAATDSKHGEETSADGNYISGTKIWRTVDDIFSSYERLHSSASDYTLAPESEMPHFSKRGTREFNPFDGDKRSNTGEGGAKYDAYGNICGESGTDSQLSGLLVTAFPLRLEELSRRREDSDPRYPPYDAAKQSPLKRPAAEGIFPPEENSAYNVRLSEVAPLPLLVFNMETFLTLGELDEGFAFQGGIAEWVSRANKTWVKEVDNTYRTVECPRFSHRNRRSPVRQLHRTYNGKPYEPPNTTGGVVQHVHTNEWGKRYLRFWRNCYVSDNGRQSRICGAPTALSSARGVNSYQNTNPRDSLLGSAGAPATTARLSPVLNGEGAPRGGAREQGSVRQGRREELGQQNHDAEQTWKQKWGRVPPDDLELLAQADVDLFLLPLFSAQLSPGEGMQIRFLAPNTKRCCVTHDSEK